MKVAEWLVLAARQPYAEYMTVEQQCMSLYKDILTRVAKAALEIPDDVLRRWGYASR